ncbi:MAG: cytochrome b N-terminal domain-containing protein [Nitrospirota bacterium]|nr:cytochrome b N-terminal domain-containing protein [Nitrospirota bacterium]
MIGKALDWIVSRSGLKEPHRVFLERRIPENLNYSYCLGGVAFTCFLISAVTGLFLSIYYVPSAKDAFHSILMINEKIFLGRTIRSLHKWSANLLIVSMLLHTIRVVINRSYGPPRELNWIAGVVLLVLVMAEGFTGYLLPWDQKAYWATVVGTNIATAIPFIGSELLYLLRGGTDVNGITLIRFYSLHVLWIPLFIILLLWAHFHMVRKLGISRPL